MISCWEQAKTKRVYAGVNGASFTAFAQSGEAMN